MIRVGRLHHASVRVSDFETSRAFYEGLLNLAQLPRPDFGFAGAWYELGDCQLHLIESPPSDRRIDPRNPHFAVEVEDYDATKTELGRRGIEFLEFGPQLWILDPDGNTVEIRRKV